MKDSEVYLRAAERVCGGPNEYWAGRLSREKEWYCCDAIGAVVGTFWSDYAMSFCDLFKPFGADYSDPFWEKSPSTNHSATGDDQDARILALCFMAAIAKSEGR